MLHPGWAAWNSGRNAAHHFVWRFFVSDTARVPARTRREKSSGLTTTSTRFGGYVVGHPVDSPNLVHHAAGYALETCGQSIPPIHFADIYVGYAILVAPDSEAKTALEFMDEGMSFTDAAAAAVQQLVGKEVHIPPHSTTQSQYSDAFFAYLPQWWEDVVEDILMAISEIPQSWSANFPTLGVLVSLVRGSFRSVFAGLGLVVA